MVCGCWVVYGTLLGPEATGPGWFRGWSFWLVRGLSGFVCFWFPGCTEHTVAFPFGRVVWGVWFGVVV